MARQKKELKKVVSEFHLLGRAKVNDYTFEIDKKSKNSDWVGSKTKLYIDCGSYGDIYCETENSGYFPSGNEENPESGSKTLVYVHGKKASEKDASKMTDDFNNRFEIAWEDRFDEEILETVGNLNFTRGAVEVDTEGKPVTSRFLTGYDLTKYLKENLEDGQIVSVHGKIEYSIYDGNVQAKKIIEYIGASSPKVKDDEKVEDKFYAKFAQTIYVSKDSLDVKGYDKEKKAFPITASVIDYVGKVSQNGETKKIGKYASFDMKYMFALLGRDEKNFVKMASSMFKPKKNNQLFQLTIDGFISKSGGADVALTVDDLPEDIKELIELGVYTEEDAIEQAVGKKSYVKEEWLIDKPQIKVVGEEDDKRPVLQLDRDNFDVEDLVTYQMRINEVFGEEEPEVEIEEDEDMDAEMLELLAQMEDE